MDEGREEGASGAAGDGGPSPNVHETEKGAREQDGEGERTCAPSGSAPDMLAPDGDDEAPGMAAGEDKGRPMRYDIIYAAPVGVTVDGVEATVRYPPSWGRVRVEREGRRPATVALDDIGDDAGRRALVSTRVRRRHELHARCAVYTRKSTSEGLDQAFNSLDAQRESCEAYIASQKALGWQTIPRRYDDGGFTGANMERPALQRLLADIEAEKTDCVAVYKVDRISRSLLDFARMMETFDKHGVSFVSVTQHFNTATPMGRLILNILLSFAQFEREIIAERTRDKIAAALQQARTVAAMRHEPRA